MDKIKNILSPGSKKDDEVLYGSAEDRRRESASKTTGQQEPEHLRPVEGSHKKEHSILGQLTNPGGDKFDDQRYGTTATTAPGDPHKLETHPEVARKEHTIMDQITNPSGDKYDPQRFEATASTPGDRKQSVRPEAPAVVGPETKLVTDPEEKKHEHSILRQIINPHGQNYDAEGYGTTAHAAGGSSAGDTGFSPPPAGAGTNFGQDAALVGGGAAATAAGAHAYSQHERARDNVPSSANTSQHPQPLTDRSVAGSSHPTTTTTTTTNTTTTTGQHQQPFDRSAAGSAINPVGAPETNAPRTGDSHLGRDAAVAGGAGVAGGAVASQLNRPRDDISAATYTERSQPLAGSATNTSAIAGAGPTSTSSVGTGASHINPVGSPEQSLEGRSQVGQDAALAGGVGAAGITSSAGVTQLNRAPADVQQATYTERSRPVGDGVVHHHQGPHSTETANRLDPHVPGEFPTETGEDRHSAQAAIVPTGSTVSQSRTAGTDVPVGGSAATQAASQQSHEPHLGRDAAVVGGVGAAGAATYAATRDHDASRLPAATQASTAQNTSSNVVGGSHGVGTTGSGAYDTTGRRAPTSQTIGSQTSGPQAVGTQPIGQSHTGRDAALGAGAGGAAGIAAYEASRNTAPASQAVGSQTSGSQAVGSSTGGSSTVGSSTVGSSTVGSSTVGSSTVGSSAVGSQAAGSQPLGSHAATSQTVGSQVPHSSTLANRAEDRVGADPLKSQQDTHYGRDAAVAGGAGAGAAGAAAYAAERSSGPTATGSNDPATIAARDAAQRHAHPATGADKVYGGGVGDDKHDHKLQKAREEEYAHGGDRGENKRGLLDKILHPGHHDKEKESTHHHDNSAKTTTDDHGHTVLHKKALGDPQHDTSSRVIEPHTGLPMDTSKGIGSGGTDGARQIEGYHETDPALRNATAGTAEGAGTKHPAHHAGEEGVAGPDWDAIKKANTPY